MYRLMVLCTALSSCVFVCPAIAQEPAEIVSASVPIYDWVYRLRVSSEPSQLVLESQPLDKAMKSGWSDGPPASSEAIRVDSIDISKINHITLSIWAHGLCAVIRVGDDSGSQFVLVSIIPKRINTAPPEAVATGIDKASTFNVTVVDQVEIIKTEEPLKVLAVNGKLSGDGILVLIGRTRAANDGSQSIRDGIAYLNLCTNVSLRGGTVMRLSEPDILSFEPLPK